ncbi:MAG TPA: hypothetical protein VE282_03525, partial [Gemmatimonadales bacterium]|nr:hypothetical protein [Gemmatimonadales bacterium]
DGHHGPRRHPRRHPRRRHHRVLDLARQQKGPTAILAGGAAFLSDFRSTDERERRFRTLGPAMLDAFLWLDDPELIRRIVDSPTPAW